MRIRRERSLQHLCDVTPTLPQPQVTPVSRGNFKMQGPSGEANCDSLTNMVASENSSHCSDRSSEVDHRGKSGTCNVCSAPCSSCFHVNNVLLKSNNEQAGETCAGNTETGPLSILSTVGGMDSTADSFSENAAGKASSRTSNASASDDSKCNGWRSLEGHDDCLSCVSGTDEQLNRKSDIDDSGNKHNKHISGEISGKISPSSSQTGIYSQKSDTVGISLTKISTNDATDLQKAQNNSEVSNDKNLSHEESQMNEDNDTPPDTNVQLLKGSVEHFNSSSPNVASDDICGDPPKTDLNSTKTNDDMDIEAHPAVESDDSDMVEQDVKVCDICGDAGREDLLAICSRCSDGAEHTYCMREMREKVPEGEWLCEECKTVELVGNGKKEKIGGVDEIEKNNSSGRVSENLNNSDVEGQKTRSSTRNPSKRLRDDEDAEVSSIVKKPALESTVGSPKTSIPKLAVLSRDSSLKSLDKGRLQYPNHSTSDTTPVIDTTELAKPASDARGFHLRGTFSKSNSFNSLNSKPKVKLVDQAVIQRQKSVKEHGSFRLKEGGVRSIGKSMSFRSTNSNRSESKTKMLSPRPSHIQDVKSTKERGALERQCSFRMEHPSNKSPSSGVESSPLASPRNHYDTKPVQSDGKSAGLLRSASLAARRKTDVPSSTGEFKRPSKHGHSIPVLSSARGVNNTEQKYNQTSLKQDPASCGVSEKLPINASEGVSDGLVQSKDLTDYTDRPREYSGSRLGQPSVRSSRDESDNLKAAIEAAVLKKPGVYRKNRALGHSDESSLPNGAPVASHIDHMSTVKSRKLSSDAELAERPPVSRNSTADPLKDETLNSVKQSPLVRPEGLYSGGRDGTCFGLSSRDTHNVPAVTPLLLKAIAIPEHEYVWQGSFEICRSGQTSELWDGIQAHLSTCVSPKVVEAVNKFKNRIVLYEVPRVSTWPAQFQENGVRDDNVALFFFAKDLQSHDKIYKVLLDNMMKNDFALRGNFNGVELLIFPSNQLPVNMQRWNMSFFLWGVFRGKKEVSLRQIPDSTIAPIDIPPPIMSLPENRCSLRPINQNASQDIHPGLEVTGSEVLQGLPRAFKRDVDIDVSPLDQLGNGLNCSSSSAVQSDGSKQCGGVTGSYQEGGISSSWPPLAMRSPITGREQMLTEPDSTLGNPHSPHDDSSKVVAGTPKEAGAEGATLEMTCHQNESKFKKDIIDLSRDADMHLENDRGIRDLNVEPDRWLFSQKEPVLPGPSPLGDHTLGADTTHLSPRNDNMHNGTVKNLEKVNHVPTISYTLQSQLSEAAGVGSIPKYYEHGERYFFPVQSQPLKGLPLTDGSMPWKTHLQDEDRLSDRAPNLELALGAERKHPTLGIEPLFVSRAEHNVQRKHVVEETGKKKKVEEDVAASLSLSLSFPFPEKEVDAMSQRTHINTSSSSSSRLLFGNLGDN